MTNRSRPAFSLFELLVILAILGLLLALFLPALAKVRQAANRINSQNNLKQLALACHNYHAAFGFFPPGNDANNFSAAAYLLPYVEQDNLYKLIDFKKPVTDAANKQVRETMVKLFLSPDDPRERVKEGLGATSYLFNAGSKPGLEKNNGVFFQDSKIRLSEIPDGTSNTLMIGETLKGDGGTKAVDVRRQNIFYKKDALKDLKDETGVQDWKNNQHIAGDRCASWIDGRFLQGTFTGTRSINDKRPDVDCGGVGGLSGLRSINTIANVAICDGSVRTLKQTIKLDTLKLLANRADGQVINDPDF